jgi:flagellar basal-body rod protein FlgG
MNYGLYLSAAGVLTNMHRQDATANNLANASTVGFKRDLAAFTQRLPESRENPTRPELADELLDRLGGGTLVRPTETDLRTGPITNTGNDLDLALDGPGFFVVQTEADGQTQARLTRDGRFTLGADGTLRMSTGGHQLLDRAGRPIQLDPTAPLQIDETGLIRQRGSEVAQMKLIDPQPAEDVRHDGFGLYRAPEAAMNNAPQAPARLVQGAVEQSNVQPIREMAEMIETSRAITFNSRLIKFHDRMMEHAATTLGRVS